MDKKLDIGVWDLLLGQFDLDDLEELVKMPESERGFEAPIGIKEKQRKIVRQLERIGCKAIKYWWFFDDTGLNLVADYLWGQLLKANQFSILAEVIDGVDWRDREDKLMVAFGLWIYNVTNFSQAWQVYTWMKKLGNKKLIEAKTEEALYKCVLFAPEAEKTAGNLNNLFALYDLVSDKDPTYERRVRESIITLDKEGIKRAEFVWSLLVKSPAGSLLEHVLLDLYKSMNRNFDKRNIYRYLR